MPGTPTTKYAIPTLNAAGTDAINVSHTQINSAFTTIDAAVAGYAEGTFAGKPAAGKAGRIYRCTDTGQWLADTGAAWVDLNTAPGLVSSLPGSPFDGQEIYYSADPTNGVVWHLRYRAASASASKWESVGGSALISEVLTEQTPGASTGTFVDLATVGPSATVPLAGDYEITFRARGENTTGSNFVFAVSLQFGASVPSPSTRDAETFIDTGKEGTLAYIGRRNVSAAGQVVKLVYYAANASIVYGDRTLSVRPIRVG